MKVPTPLRSALVVGVALSLSGCGTRYGKVEQIIRTDLGRQIGVNCPAGVAQEQGEDFECGVVDTEGSTGKVAVTQTDGSGSIDMKLK